MKEATQDYRRKKHKLNNPQKQQQSNVTLHATENKRCKLGGGVGIPQRCLQGEKRHPRMASTPKWRTKVFQPNS